MGTINALLVWAITALIAGFAAYFGAYFTKKGENLATKEDLDELTRRAREIEAKIDNQVWNGQRQWELKRDALLATVSVLRGAHTAAQNMHAAYDMVTKVKDEIWKERVSETTKVSSAALATFDEKRFEASLVCDETVNSALDIAASAINRCRIYLVQQKLEEARDMGVCMDAAVNSAVDAMRMELGFMPLSSGSSAVRGPG